jgi:hypothetical protein
LLFNMQVTDRFYLFFDEMTINLDMFCTIMLNRIMSYAYSCLVITIQF